MDILPKNVYSQQKLVISNDSTTNQCKSEPWYASHTHTDTYYQKSRVEFWTEWKNRNIDTCENKNCSQLYIADP